MAKYDSVNSLWPEGSNEGREIIPTGDEALKAVKRLYRKAMGKPFKGKVKLTSGRNYTYVRRHVLYVNPNQTTWQGNGGWHEIVHGISHYASRALYNEAHGHRHAFIERELIEYVVKSGFLTGKLKKANKPAPDKKTIKLERTDINLARWKSKLKRANNAIRKLEQTKKRLQRAA